MALKGDTSNLLLADIFQTLFQNGQSGMLHLRSEVAERRVMFAPHGVTLYDANVFDGRRLGNLLVSGGLVPQRTVDDALTEIARHGNEPFSSIKLLVVLDEDGHLTLQHGVAVLRMEVREELFEVFTLDRMEFEFLEDDIPSESIPKECYFRPEEVVMEAARRVDEWGRIREVVGLGDRYYVASPDTKAEGAEEVVSRLDGSNTTIDIAETLLVSRFEVARVVWQLLEANQLRPATVDELLRSARGIDPSIARARIEKILRRVVAMLDESDPRIDAAAEVAVAAKIRSLAVELLVRRARALLKTGHTEAAQAESQRARDLDPEDRSVLETLAELHRARNEREAEVKILTVLAEKSAREKRFDVAFEVACRIAQLTPDSPMLDHAFVVYCQNANRAAAGVEVLARAAGLRTTKTGVAQLYRSILTLDPLRSDVRKMLSRLDRTAKRGRLAGGIGILLLLPAIYLGIQHLLGRIESARLSGRIEAAQKMLDEGEIRAARTTLDALLLDSLDAESKAAVERLSNAAAEKLKEKDDQEQTRAIHDARTELEGVQTALDSGDLGTALDRMVAFDRETVETGRESVLDAKRKVLAQAIEQEVGRLESRAREFVEPKEDLAIADVLAYFEPDFSSTRAAEFELLTKRARELRSSKNWEGLAPRIVAAADRGKAALDGLRPKLLELEARRDRNSELDVLSDDYELILDFERRGDFASAASAYDRLLREYGEGNLTRYFEKKRSVAVAIASGLDQAEALFAKNDAEGAAARVAALFKETTEFDLTTLIGSPHRIETHPDGVEAILAGESIGRTPLVVYTKADAPLVITLRASGFQDTSCELAFDSPARVAVDLRRESRFSVALAAPVDETPACSNQHIFVGARDGVVYRLKRSDGARDGEYRSKSLSGVNTPPILTANTLVLAFGEGVVAGVDPERLVERWNSTLDSRVVGDPLVEGDRILAATERGTLVTIDVKSGDVRALGNAEAELRAGPARIGNSLAVAAKSGELIVFAERDGAILFRTPRSATPLIGVLAVTDLFVAADDAGRLFAYDATDGALRWSLETGSAAAAAPALKDGLLVIAAGQVVRVLDAATGESRGEVSTRDWISATPVLAGGRIYVCDRAGSLDAFDLSTRARLFRHALGSTAVAPPIVLPEGILVVTVGGMVSLIGS